MVTPTSDQIALMLRRRAQEEDVRRLNTYQIMKRDEAIKATQNRMNFTPKSTTVKVSSSPPRSATSSGKKSSTVRRALNEAYQKALKEGLAAGKTKEQITAEFNASLAVNKTNPAPNAGAVVFDLGSFGNITQGDFINTYNINLKDIPGNTMNTKNTSLANLNTIVSNLKTSLQNNINYISKYIKWIEEGKTVVKAKNSLFIVGDTPTEAMSAANDYQGGYVKTYTVAELKDMLAQYQSLLGSVETINIPEQEVTTTPSNVENIVSAYEEAHPEPLDISPSQAVQTILDAQQNAPEGFEVTRDAYSFYYIPIASYWANGVDYSALTDAQKEILNITSDSDELLPNKVFYDPKTKQFSVSYKINPEKWDSERDYADLPDDVKALLSGVTIYPVLTAKISYDAVNDSFNVNYTLDPTKVPPEGIPYDKLSEYGLSSLTDSVPVGSTVFVNEQGELYYTLPESDTPQNINWSELPTTISGADLEKYGITLSEPVAADATVYVDPDKQKFYVLPADMPTANEGFTLALNKDTPEEGDFTWVPNPDYWSTPRDYNTLPQSIKDILGITDPEYSNPDKVTYTNGEFSVSYTPDWSKLPDTIPYSDLAKYGLNFEDVPEGSIIKVDKVNRQFTVSEIMREGGNVDFGIPVTAHAIFGSSFINVEGAGGIGTDPLTLPDPTIIVHPLTETIFNLTKDANYPSFAAAIGAGGIEPSVSENPLESQLFYPGQAVAGMVGSVEAILNPNIPSAWSLLNPSSEQSEFMRAHPSYALGAGLGEVVQMAIPVPYLNVLGKWASEIPFVSRASSFISHSKPVQLARRAATYYDDFMGAALKKVGYSPPISFEDFLFIGTPDDIASKVASQSYSSYIESIGDIQNLMKSRKIPRKTVAAFEIDVVAEPTTFTPLGGWRRVTPSKDSKLILSDIKAIDVTSTIRQSTKSTISIMPKSPLEQYSSLLSKAEYYDDLFRTSTSRLGKPITVKKVKPSIGGVVTLDSKATLSDLDNLLDTSANWFMKPSADDFMRQSLASKPPLYDTLLDNVSNFKIGTLTDEGFQSIFEKSASRIPDIKATPHVDIAGEREISRLIGKGSKYQLAKKASQKGTVRVRSAFEPRAAPDYFGTDLWLPTERITPLPDVVPATKEVFHPSAAVKKSSGRQATSALRTEQPTDYDFLFAFKEKDRLVNISSFDTRSLIKDNLSLPPLTTLSSALKSVTKLKQKQKVGVKPKLTPTDTLATRLQAKEHPISDIASIPTIASLTDTEAMSKISQIGSLKMIPDVASVVSVKTSPVQKQPQKLRSRVVAVPKMFTEFAPPLFPPVPSLPKSDSKLPRKQKKAAWDYYELTHYVDDLLGIGKVKMNNETNK